MQVMVGGGDTWQREGYRCRLRGISRRGGVRPGAGSANMKRHCGVRADKSNLVRARL